MLPSTNDYANNWLQSEDSPPAGSVIITDCQTNGKGQASNQWLSKPQENLTFSMIYYPVFLPLDNLFALNMVASLSVRNVLSKYTRDIYVKWPNDVLIASKKAAGVLIKNTLSGKKITTSIVGIGLNINQLDFPTLPKATSLSIATGQKHDRNTILNEVISAFENLYQRLKTGGYMELKKAYLDKLYLFNTMASFAIPNGSNFRGKIIGVKEDGRLVIKKEGRTVYYRFQEIIFLD